MNYIYGAGGHGKVVLDALVKAGDRCHAFIDDKSLQTWANLPVITSLTIPSDATLHFAIGNSQVRETLATKFQGYQFFSVLHPQAAIAASASISQSGTLIAAQAVIGPDASIGNHCIINHGAIVDHDCVVNDFCHIAPNAVLGGGVQIGRHVLVGAGAVVLPGVHIADHVTIGAGAVVTKDITQSCVMSGVPAKPHSV